MKVTSRLKRHLRLTSFRSRCLRGGLDCCGFDRVVGTAFIERSQEAVNLIFHLAGDKRSRPVHGGHLRPEPRVWDPGDPTLFQIMPSELQTCTGQADNPLGADDVFASASSVWTPSYPEIYSSRIAKMLAVRSACDSELESETADSGCTSVSEVEWSEFGDEDPPVIDHGDYFEMLQADAHWGSFCSEVTNVVVGRKIGEGDYSNIYEAQVTFRPRGHNPVERDVEYVVKVMLGDYGLEDFQRQWPPGLVGVKDSLLGLFSPILYGTLVWDPLTRSRKFGFVMRRYWGDLRRLIDLRMERRHARGPPFSFDQAVFIMFMIAVNMMHLHGRGILHRDLKSSNVLLNPASHLGENCDLVTSEDPHLLLCGVTGWERSLGVVGTGFWRAPEILRQLKSRTPLVFDEKADVYSFAMTSYEIITGLRPFEDHQSFSETRDAVLNGARPQLPPYLKPAIKALITWCWAPYPEQRPSFNDILELLRPLL